MAKLNLAFLYGRVAKEPMIAKPEDPEDASAYLGTMYLDVVRGKRDVGDKITYLKHDSVLVLTFDEEYVTKMEQCHKNDIVLIKGVVTTKRIKKNAPCPYCKEHDMAGIGTTVDSIIVYVTPLHIEKIKSYDEKLPAVTDIANRREISNQVFVYGTVLKDPKFVVTKQKIQITQYPIAINRKYTIRMDDPSIKTDYPIVKSYGEQARDDKTFLKFQAEVLVDGFLQTRSVVKNKKCPCCGNFYKWRDNTCELVPYAVEYLTGFKTEEEVEAEQHATVEQYKQALFDSGVNDELDDFLKSDDVVDNQ